MGRLILRILVSDPTEIKFVTMSCMESREIVDHVIIVEHNYTHTGKPKPYYFDKQVEKKLEELSGNKDIQILQVDLGDVIIQNASSKRDVHLNEHLMRISFLDKFTLNDNDLIISVDADEVIYRKALATFKIIDRILPSLHLNFALLMHQFFYKPNYHWTNLRFRSSTIVRASILKKNPKAIRDTKVLMPFWTGCHFSWQLEPAEMVQKLSNYAHSPEYIHLADEELLRKAVSNRTYPFDYGRKFLIDRLTPTEAKGIFPNSYWKLESQFSSYLRDWDY